MDSSSFDENVDTSNAQLDVSSASIDVLKKSLAKTPAAKSTRGSITASASRPTKTPGTAARSTRHSTGSSVDYTQLPAATVMTMLVKQSTPAQQQGTQHWEAQEKFAQMFLDAMRHTELPTVMPPHTQTLLLTLRETLGCGRSGTQTKSLEGYRALFEACSASADASPAASAAASTLRGEVKDRLDLAFHSVFKLVEHNSSAFLSSGATLCLRAAMRHVAPVSVLDSLASQLLSKAHDTNAKKFAAIVRLMADAMDVCVTGAFTEGSAAAKDYPCPNVPVLGARHRVLTSTCIRDVIRCVVKVKSGPHPALRPAADALLRGLAEKGGENHALTAEIRALGQTDRSSANMFEGYYEVVMGRKLQTLTTATAAATAAVESSPTPKKSPSSRAPMLSSTLTSPLPTSALRGAKGAKAAYAETMPRNILSPGEVIPIRASPSSSSATIHQSASKLNEAYPLPSPMNDADYQTAGPGLLPELEAMASEPSDENDGLTYTYSTVNGTAADENEHEQVVDANDITFTEVAAASSVDAADTPQKVLDFGDEAIDAGVDTTAAAAAGVDDSTDSEIVFKSSGLAVDVNCSMLDVSIAAPLSTATHLDSTTSNIGPSVYNYSRASMVSNGDSHSRMASAIGVVEPIEQEEGGLLSPNSLAAAATFSPVGVAAVAPVDSSSSSATSSRRASSGKRKLSETNLQGCDEPSISAAYPSASQSPRTRLHNVKISTRVMKKQRTTSGGAGGDVTASQTAELLSHANAATEGLIARAETAATASLAYWQEKRAAFSAKIDEREARVRAYKAKKAQAQQQQHVGDADAAIPVDAQPDAMEQ